MTMNPREKDLGAKKEEEGEYSKFPKIMTPSSSSRQWSSTFKNPRIVRVSRSFGGKDRHSKVCTVRGLRDRRIRLSVPTAIQLYDLQERLGLSQPSKVIDWLLDATKLEIDKLPPLPIIPANFLQHFHHPTTLPLPNTTPHDHHHHPSPYAAAASEFLSPNLFKERERWSVEQENGEGFGGFVAQNLFPLNSHQFSVPNLPYNSNYFQLEPPNLSLSQFGGGFSTFSNRSNDHHHQEHDSSSSSRAAASSSQIYMSPSAAATTVPHFPAYFVENDDDHFRQSNEHLQNSSLHLINSSPLKSFSLNASINSSDNNETGKGEKDNGRSS